MWIYANPNPKQKQTGDCVIRAIALATGKTWYRVYDELAAVGYTECDMMNNNSTWGLYLYRLGFQPFLISDTCPACVTIRAFCHMFPAGTYIIGTGDHAVAVIDGDYYDSWDSGDAIPSYFWKKQDNERG